MAVNILDTPSNITSGMTFSPTGGASHALIWVARRNSSGTATPVTSLTIGGQSATLLAGYSSGTYQRSASGLWAINQSQIAAMVGSTVVTSGGSGTLLVIALSISGASQTALAVGEFGQVDPADSIAATLNRSISLNRTSDGVTLSFQHWNLVGSPVTMTTPSRDYNVSDGGSTISIGYEPDAATSTVSASWANANTTTYSSFLAVSFKPIPAQLITSINGGAGVKIGSTGNIAATSGFASAPTTVTIGSLTGTVTAYNSGTGDTTFSVPAPTHEASYPDIDSTQTVTLSNGGGETASLTGVPFEPPTGSTAITVSSPINDDPRNLGYWMLDIFGVTAANGDKFYGIDADVTWTADTGGSAVSLPVTTPVVYWDASTGIAYLLDVTVNPDGIVSNGITARAITAVGITATGLTARPM